MVGRVCAFVNPTMPGSIKIVATNRNPEERLREANSSPWLDTKFSIAWVVGVDDAFAVKRRIFAAFAEHRTNQSRDFFCVTPEEALMVLSTDLRAREGA